MAKSAYKLYVDGKPGVLRPGVSSGGTPLCVNCAKPIPSIRRDKYRQSLFHSDTCAMEYAEYVAAQLLAPDEPAAKRIKKKK